MGRSVNRGQHGDDERDPSVMLQVGSLSSPTEAGSTGGPEIR
jgi:hypothetical protein